jgi:MFS superfamily sulfate permease-like transporter
MSTILLIILILLLIGAVPAWPHSKGWGYYPSGLLGIVVIVLIVMLLMGRISRRGPAERPAAPAGPRFFREWPSLGRLVARVRGKA